MSFVKTKIGIAVVLIFSLTPRIAKVTHSEKEISLDQAVKLSQWICVAEYLGPHKTIGAGHRFRTQEILKGHEEAKRVSGEITVVTPRAVANAMVEKVYNTTGVRRFPLIPRLREGIDFPGKKGDTVILFLKEHDDKVVALVAQNAVFGLDKKEIVTKAITASKQQPSNEH